MQKFSPAQKAFLNALYAGSGSTIATSQIALDGGLAVGAVSLASFWTQFATAAQGALATAAQPGLKWACFQDQKANNTPGGTFTQAAWRTRDLNTAVVNTITGASLASNQITLPVGTYHIEASAPAYIVNSHKTQLYSVTASAALLLGTSEYCDAGGYTQTTSKVSGFFTLAAPAVLELQHYCQSTEATDGFGKATNFGVVEVYSRVMLLKVA